MIQNPDVVAPAARRWRNVFGYAVMVGASKLHGPIWTVRVYQIPPEMQ
jgi:hypothetical protein